MAVTYLEPVFDVWEADRFGEDSPMRKVTRQVAFEGGWDATRATKVADLFTSMSKNWTADHDIENRYWPLTDALDRGDVSSTSAVELGSGTGLGTRILSQRFDHVAAFDLSSGMLRNAPAEYGQRVQADASTLPLRDGSVETLVLVNMLLFPAEVDRVLSDAGTIVWVNTVGEQTPIHLSADDVVTALPGAWQARASRAGQGTWCTATREVAGETARRH